MLHTFLLVIQIIVAAALVGVILMQRSEGGGLSGGGSSSGLMSARGAGDFLTRTTAILGTLFILNSIGLAVLASVDRAPTAIDTSLAQPAVPAAAPPVAAPAQAAPVEQPAGNGTGAPVPLAQ